MTPFRKTYYGKSRQIQCGSPFFVIFWLFLYRRKNPLTAVCLDGSVVSAPVRRLRGPWFKSHHRNNVFAFCLFVQTPFKSLPALLPVFGFKTVITSFLKVTTCFGGSCDVLFLVRDVLFLVRDVFFGFKTVIYCFQ